MTSTVEFINRWQRIALLSQSLLELAQRGEWDLLLQTRGLLSAKY